MDHQKHYDNARKKVEKIKKFYKDAVGMIAVMVFLIFINLKFSPGYHWFWWPIIGMSIGLVSDYIKVFGFPFANGFLGQDWEERKIWEEMKRMEDKEEEVKYLVEKDKDQIDINQKITIRDIEKLKAEDSRQ